MARLLLAASMLALAAPANSQPAADSARRQAERDLFEKIVLHAGRQNVAAVWVGGRLRHGTV